MSVHGYITCLSGVTNEPGVILCGITWWACRARGLSRSTATRGREIAWELGFFDVLEPGTIHHAGRYRYTERWRKYPGGNYKLTGQMPPGKNVYPLCGFRRKEDAGSDILSNFDENLYSSNPQVVKRSPCVVIQLAPKHPALVTY